jgi:uncharacterized membrane protein
MRKLMILAFVANLLLLLVSLLMLPDQVAIHFRGGGVPDAWASKWTHTLIFVVIQIPLFTLFLSAGRLTLNLPARWLSLPNKDYWLKPENRRELQLRFSALMQEFGFMLFFFLFAVGLLTLDANVSDPVCLNEPVFLMFFTGFMLYLPYWLVKVIRRLKVPR